MLFKSAIIIKQGEEQKKEDMAWYDCCKLTGLTLSVIALLALIIGCFLFIDAATLTVGVRDVKISSLNITQAPGQPGFMLASADLDLIARVDNPSPRTRHVLYEAVEISVSYVRIPIAQGPISSTPFSDSPHVSIAFFYPRLFMSNVLLPADAALALNASQMRDSTERHRTDGDAPLIQLTFHIQASVKVIFRKLITMRGLSMFVCDLYLCPGPPDGIIDSDTMESSSSHVIKKHCKTLHTFLADHH